MDILGLVSVPGWLLGILLFLTIAYLYTKWHHRVWKNLGVPGPPPTPYLGYFGKLRKMSFPEFDVDMRKKYGKFVGLYHGHLPCFLIFDAEVAKQVCVKEFSTFPNRFRLGEPIKEFQSALSLAKDDHWKFLRNTMTPTFSSGKMRYMNPAIQKCYETLVKNFGERSEGGKTVEVKELFGAYTMDVIASTAFGLEIDSQKDTNNEFVKRAKAAFNVNFLSPLIILSIIFPSFAKLLNRLRIVPKATKEVVSYFQKTVVGAINSRTAEDKERKDFLQLMLNAHKETPDAENLNKYKGDPEKWKDRGLTLDEITSNALIFFLAGYETTANTLAFSGYCLALNPDCQEKCIEEIDSILGEEKPDYDNVQKLQYLDMFVSEVLRMHPPAIRTNRHAETDTEIAGYKIPKDTDVSIGIYAMHMDPEYWDDPEKFDPEKFTAEAKANRHPYAYLPFGIGPRNCIGMRLALMEVKCALVAVLQKYRFMKCEETEIPIQYAKIGLLSPLNGIKLKIEER